MRDLLQRKKIFDLRRIHIHAESLKNNFLKDSVEREVIILERKVNASTPVLIGLPAYFGNHEGFLHTSYTHHSFIKTLELIIEDNPDISFIMVIPDTMTSYFGNQYLNSPAVGNYEDFISKDIIKFVSKRYGRRRIGLFGKSSGGFGAYNILVNNHENFDGFIDVSGDSGFEYCYMKDIPEAIKQVKSYGLKGFISRFKNAPNPSRSELSAMNMIAMSAFYSPEISTDLRFELPFDTIDFNFSQRVWEKWIEHDPLRTIENNLANLKGKTIIFQVGKYDEFSMNIGMSGLSKILKRNKISHEFIEYDAGHLGTDYFYRDSIPKLLKGLND